MTKDELARFNALGVATVYEASGRQGTIDMPLIQLLPGSRVAGPARTVLCGQDDNLMVHAAMEQIQPGEILVLTMPQPAPVALVGELLATQVKVRGAAGILVDAAVRDVEELVELGLPIWTRFIRVKGANKTSIGDLNVTVPDDPNLEIYYQTEWYQPPEHLRPALKNQASRYPDHAIGLRRIDHINLLAADVRATRIFMEELLGMRLTEQVIFDDGSEKASWLTATNKSYDVAIAEDWTGTKGRLHHITYTVDSREAILRAADICLEHNVPIETGPHKHDIQQTFFLYMIEPGGNRFEIANAGARLILAPDWELSSGVRPNARRARRGACRPFHPSTNMARRPWRYPMPQLTLEYTGNLDFEVQAILARLHSELVATGAINLKGLKSRAVRHDAYRIADGNPDYAFVHVNLLIREGRAPEIQSEMAQRVMAGLKETFGDRFENDHVSLSVDIKEMRQGAALTLHNIPEIIDRPSSRPSPVLKR